MKRNRTNGFTYFELLISLAVLAMISVALTSSLSFGRQAWLRSNQLDTISKSAIARQDLRDWLYLVEDTSTLSGTSNQLSFQLKSPQLWQLDIYARQVTIEKIKNNESFDLIMQIKDTGLNGEHRPNRFSTIATGLKTINFQYFGIVKPGLPKTWVRTWVGSNAQLLLFKIEGETQSGNVWPYFAAAVGQNPNQREISASSLAPPN